MQLDGLFEIQLETIENAICLETINTEFVRSVKLYIPKLMPLANMEEPKDQTIYINKSILVNEAGSLPKSTYKITASNYISVPLAGGSFYKDIINKGQQVCLMIPNKNIRDMRVISM